MKRVCKWPGCITILTYNKNVCCHAHQGMYVRKLEAKIADFKRDIERHKDYIRHAARVEQHHKSVARLQDRMRATKRILTKAGSPFSAKTTVDEY